MAIVIDIFILCGILASAAKARRDGFLQTATFLIRMIVTFFCMLALHPLMKYLLLQHTTLVDAIGGMLQSFGSAFTVPSDAGLPAVLSNTDVERSVGYLSVFLVKLLAALLSLCISGIGVKVLFAVCIHGEDMLDRVPFFRKANRTLGFLLGILLGVCWLWFVLFLAFLLVTLINHELGYVIVGFLEESKAFYFLYNYNPLLAFVR